jgi:hypothetical protein
MPARVLHNRKNNKGGVMYEAGVAVAFCLWLWGAVRIPILVNSTHEENLRKIGLRHSWWFGNLKPLTKKYLEGGVLKSLGRYLLIIGFGLPWIFLSWAQVVLAAGHFIYSLSKRYGEPQAIKEFRWRLHNTHMTFEQIADGFYQINGGIGQKEDFIRELREDLRERGLR